MIFPLLWIDKCVHVSAHVEFHSWYTISNKMKFISGSLFRVDLRPLRMCENKNILPNLPLTQGEALRELPFAKQHHPQGTPLLHLLFPKIPPRVAALRGSILRDLGGGNKSITNTHSSCFESLRQQSLPFCFWKVKAPLNLRDLKYYCLPVKVKFIMARWFVMIWPLPSHSRSKKSRDPP